MLIKVRGKECKSYVKYQKQNKIIYDDSLSLRINNNSNDNISVFQKQNLQKEVNYQNLSLKGKKKVNKWIKSLTLSASSFLVAIPVSAQEVVSATADLPSHADLLAIAQWAIGYSTIAIVAGGVVWIVVTRILQFPAIEKYRKMALEIATNTIKGITEALLIPTLVGIIIGVAILLFGGIGVFNLPL